MSAYHVLEPALKDILDVIVPLREDWIMRLKIIEDLQDAVRSVGSFRGATVEPFGSFVSNLFTRGGDLDVTIMLSNGSCLSYAGKKYKQNVLADLLRAMRQRGGWWRLQFIPNARVPILKVESSPYSISCDISIDNLQGQMKSKFLFWINEIDSRFRDLVLLVKEWAKAHNINNPKTGSFNSYTLSLLVIFHFQTCVPAIFPPLKDIYPRNAVDDLMGLRADAEQRIQETCLSNVNRFRSDKFRTINRSSLSELFISFMAKFSDINLKAVDLGICTFTGQWEAIRTNMRWLPKTYAIFVEDPFEQPENSARAVSAGNLEKISKAFQTTHQRLTSTNQNRISLLSTLVRTNISHAIGGTPIRNPSYSFECYPATRPQMSRAVYSPSQVQRQVQHGRQEDHTKNSTCHPDRSSKRKQENRPNNLTKQRPVQQHHSQSQQIWRPKSCT